jgi:protein-L-isoaspartate(D-aspartate) O-methyltransferase
MNKFTKKRFGMVKKQITGRGIYNKKVIKAMLKIPRHKFVPKYQEHLSYEDTPLDIGYKSTISQPYIVALSCQLLNLKGNETVLEIGTGSGYQTAILSLLAKQVVSLEIITPLVLTAQKRLKKLGYIKNCLIINKDGCLGHKPQAPYDAIISAAASKTVPMVWKQQLKNNGVIIMPKVYTNKQELVKITKKNKKYTIQSSGEVIFVPLK